MAELTTDQLAELTDDDYKTYIQINLHPVDDTAAAWGVLLSEEAIERTTVILKDMRENVDRTSVARKRDLDKFQMECLARGRAGRQDWLAEKAKYEEWRRRANGFRRLVNTRQIQAKQAWKDHRQRLHEEKEAVNVHRYREVVRALCLRIHQHQALTAASGRTPEQHDHDLWQLLDMLSVPVGEDPKRPEAATLRDMIRSHWMDVSPALMADGVRRRAERLMKQAPAGRSPRYEPPRARHVGRPKPLA